MSRVRIDAPPRINIRDREFILRPENRKFLRTKEIRHAKGTIVMKIDVVYYKGQSNRKYKGEATGQATSDAGEYVDEHVNTLIRRAFKDGMIRFLEARGLSYSNRWNAQIKDFFFIYWERGRKQRKPLNINKVREQVPDIITDFSVITEEDLRTERVIPLSPKRSIVEFERKRRQETRKPKGRIVVRKPLRVDKPKKPKQKMTREELERAKRLVR